MRATRACCPARDRNGLPNVSPPTIAEVEAIADAIEDRYRVLVLLGAWSGLRWGELIGLTRSSIDLLHGTVTVSQAMVELGSSAYVGPPKSDTGRRTVHIPPHLIPEVEWHLEKYVPSRARCDGLHWPAWWHGAPQQLP